MPLADPVPLGALLGAVACALVGSSFAAVDAAFGALGGARLSALHQTSTGWRKVALDRYVADPVALHARWLVGRVLFTSLSAVLVAAAMLPAVPSWAIVPVGALGGLLTYGLAAEVFTAMARVHAEWWAPALGRWTRPLETLLWPVAAPMAIVAHLARRWIAAPARDSRVTETAVEWAVSEGEREGTIAEGPAEMIRNVLDLKDVVAREVMVPRTRVTALEESTALDEVLRVVATEGHSRYPVYRRSVDDIVGLLFAKDLFRVVRDGKLAETRLRDIARTAVIHVAESQSVASVLAEMRALRQHLAVVNDEFGGFSGIVTLEDVLEEIVGDIRDEYDTEEDAPIQPLDADRWLVDAALSAQDLAEVVGIEIEGDGDFDSVGGLVTHAAGRVPAIGDEVHAFGLRFVVRDANEKRIARVEVCRMLPVVPKERTSSKAPPAVTTSPPPAVATSTPPPPPAAASTPPPPDPAAKTPDPPTTKVARAS